MSQISLRDLSPAVEAHLRERARIEGRSLSRIASEILAKASGLGESGKIRDLSRFAGTWSHEEAAEFERAQGAFSVIDEELWT
jgi:plasmid stability protein